MMSLGKKNKLNGIYIINTLMEITKVEIKNKITHKVKVWVGHKISSIKKEMHL